MEYKTYGQKVTEHQAKNIGVEDHVNEYVRELQKDMLDNIQETIVNTLKNPEYHKRDFYIVFLNRIERVGGAIRRWCVARKSPPTPVYNHSVFKYHHQSGELEFLWMIPEQFRYWDLYRNSHQYLQDPKWASQTKFVILMESGELLKWVQKENNEDPNEKVVAIKV